MNNSFRYLSTIGLFCAGVVGCFGFGDHVETPPGTAEILHQIEVASHAANDRDYTETRKYLFRNSRFKKLGEMNVKATHRQNSAIQLEILAGPAVDDTSGRVFREVMEGERDLSLAHDADRALIAANYQVKTLGVEQVRQRECYVLDITPRRKSRFLLKGRAWIDKQSFHLVRIEGRPSASLSIWVGKPLITQDFDEVSGLWVKTRSHTAASTFFLGTSELTIQHGEFTPLTGEMAATK